MAGNDAVVSNNPQSHLSRHQFDALVASHRAFHEVAIKVSDILQDSSRSAYYQSIPSKIEDDIDVNYIDYGQNVSRGSRVVPRHQSGDLEDHSKPDLTFLVENSRARKSYRQKRQRSIGSYAHTSLSYLAADYGFQCILAS